MKEKEPLKNKKRQRYRLLYNLEEHMEIPMFLLAITWLYFLIVELIKGLSSTQELIVYIIWFIFILEYLLKLFHAPRKISYIKKNWITLIALIIPALRVLRIFYALRLLNSARLINSTRIIRALTSGKRFFSALKGAQGEQPSPEMNIGIVLASAGNENIEDLKAFTQTLIADVKKELEEATKIAWIFDIADAIQLENDDPKRPSHYLDRASMQMAQGPYDLVTVITDVDLVSRKNRTVAGLCSEAFRIMVVSTRKLTVTGRNQPPLKLNNRIVASNCAFLFLHLVGHLLGLQHLPHFQSKVMQPFEIDESRASVPSFSSMEKAKLEKRAKVAPDRELRNGNYVESFVFHLLMAFRHPKTLLKPLINNGAFFLSLSLPGLATAAVAPAIILIFTAEIWDVGLGMTNSTAAVFAGISIMLASFYLVRVQSLFLPRKEKRVITEHLAVANTVIYLSIFLACIGLFVLIGALMMVIEVYVFPADLMQTWPTLNKPEILLSDKIRLAVFISTIGVTTGALAGGLENRTIIQHLAFFKSQE